MGFGGPRRLHGQTMEKYQRIMPGRLISASIDANGKPVLELQTREQHIRREKATSTFRPRRCFWPSWPRCTRLSRPGRAAAHLQPVVADRVSWQPWKYRMP
ncbi:MAG: hypothetical protein H6667_24645 [Ardenticatenaceae bacterium]|nr:hypothetical protein [Ardenticatenaceae bacterium]